MDVHEVIRAYRRWCARTGRQVPRRPRFCLLAEDGALFLRVDNTQMPDGDPRALRVYTVEPDRRGPVAGDGADYRFTALTVYTTEKRGQP